MTKLFKIFILTFSLTGCFLIGCQNSPTEKTPQPTPASQRVTCTLNKDTRLIEILPYQQSGCDVLYTKFKTAKSIAKAQTENGYCREVSQKIITNLTNSGFICE